MAQPFPKQTRSYSLALDDELLERVRALQTFREAQALGLSMEQSAGPFETVRLAHSFATVPLPCYMSDMGANGCGKVSFGLQVHFYRLLCLAEGLTRTCLCNVGNLSRMGYLQQPLGADLKHKYCLPSPSSSLRKSRELMLN